MCGVMLVRRRLSSSTRFRCVPERLLEFLVDSGPDSIRIPLRNFSKLPNVLISSPHRDSDPPSERPEHSNNPDRSGPWLLQLIPSSQFVPKSSRTPSLGFYLIINSLKSGLACTLSFSFLYPSYVHASCLSSCVYYWVYYCIGMYVIFDMSTL